MQSVQQVYDDKRGKYERYVREHWDDMAGWEREQYVRFAWLVADRGRERALLATPEHAPGIRPRFLGETPVAKRREDGLVSIAYVLAIVGIAFFPFILESAAILLALVNMLFRRWDHAIVQLVIALAVLVLAWLGHTGANVAMPAVTDFIASYQ